MVTEKMEEYLEALYKLGLDGEKLNPARLSEYLNVTPPTVLDMLKRLESEGFVRYADTSQAQEKAKHSRRGISLTAKGQRAAKALVRRHRLSERFLTDVLGLDWESAHREACRFEHILSPEVEERLAEMLGNPETCPHGYPIPDEKGNIKESAKEMRPLCDFAANEKGCIARVEEEQPEFLQYLASLGLLPNVDIEVKEVAPFGGPLLVKIGDTQYALVREVAAKIWTTKKRGRGR
jgi:DtxR family Mn-dependent transcriptional regulator